MFDEGGNQIPAPKRESRTERKALHIAHRRRLKAILIQVDPIIAELSSDQDLSDARVSQLLKKLELLEATL